MRLPCIALVAGCAMTHPVRIYPRPFREKAGGGDWQLVANFAVAPTSFQHPKKIRLSTKG